MRALSVVRCAVQLVVLRVKRDTCMFVATQPRNIALSRRPQNTHPRPPTRVVRIICFPSSLHSQGLAAAEAEGRLPPLPEGTILPNGRTNAFDPNELDEHWSRHLNFDLLGGPDPRCVEAIDRISSDPAWNLDVVAFSNGPRKYVLRVLEEIGLIGRFPPDRVFGVTDVLPHCKPDAGSFETVLASVGARPGECVMVEDSMKNIRVAKALGMRTILVVGKGRGGIGRHRRGVGARQAADDDAPDETDPAVDAAVEVASEVADVLKMWLDS